MTSPWDDVVAVGIRTTNEGPFSEDMFWTFLLDGRSFEIPTTEIGVGDLAERFHGLDYGKIIRASTSVEHRIFRIWHRDEPLPPSKAELATRFESLVLRLGADRQPARMAFERLYKAWNHEARRYHNLEHLSDCLRELDRARPADAGDLIELAIWYHDAVYEPGAHDNEERSALLLVQHLLGVPRGTVQTVGELVRGTTHATVATSPELDLLLDIDLSILGRDPLRFMDYEHSIEDEYAPRSMSAFRAARGRFLSSLLARRSIFRTDAFRARYEQQARSQLAALLRSPRYA